MKLLDTLKDLIGYGAISPREARTCLDYDAITPPAGILEHRKVLQGIDPGDFQVSGDIEVRYNDRALLQAVRNNRAGMSVTVRAASLSSQPKTGDSFFFEGAEYRVSSVEKDMYAGTWTLDLEPAPAVPYYSDKCELPLTYGQLPPVGSNPCSEIMLDSFPLINSDTISQDEAIAQSVVPEELREVAEYLVWHENHSHEHYISPNLTPEQEDMYNSWASGALIPVASGTVSLGAASTAGVSIRADQFGSAVPSHEYLIQGRDLPKPSMVDIDGQGHYKCQSGPAVFWFSSRDTFPADNQVVAGDVLFNQKGERFVASIGAYGVVSWIPTTQV